MNLPWLDLQAVYAHAAWGVVLAALGVAVLARRRVFRQRLAIGWVLLALAVCALPGAASPAYWLSLAFHLPSLMLVACCGMVIAANVRGHATPRVLPIGLSAGLALCGAVLYADTVGWLHLGLYVRGFGAEAAFAGLLVGAAAAFAITAGQHRAAGLAVLLSTTVFALSRLPSGNVWDALLDPLLWLWVVYSLVSRAVVLLRSGRVVRNSA